MKIMSIHIHVGTTVLKVTLHVTYAHDSVSGHARDKLK